MSAATPRDGSDASSTQLMAELRQEAKIRESSGEAAYLERIRAAALRFRTQEAASGDIRSSVTALEQYVSITAVPALEAPNAGARMAKRILRKAMFFGLHHLAEQTSALGWATVWLGTSVAERIERLEAGASARDSDWRREMTELQARLERLERSREKSDQRNDPT